MTKDQEDRLRREVIELARNPRLREIKDFFRKVRHEQAEIQELKNLIQEKELELMPRAIRYDGIKVQVSPDDITSRVCAAISDLEMELGKQIIVLAKHQAQAESLIAKLQDSNERRVMRYYYLTTIEGQLPSWNQVAIRMNYYESYVKKLHGKALANLAKE